eukprot:CAMPEP_0177199248 /NCGR_PEP_ID=MMETSP0367-20130122/25572_1 /TAXON_ID=447022 ORGANISM="Scrippsiella hangoei-like, Strain SHHI-4" /NCGR_SAMPLE_ID=MMETSP0367 /ASSEMBLY_ACC=CAM_ASM_000362 /LENGTH=138 /DNA_ID=CAMNT_0018647583 /DNA_START=254 /DNA_END=666 /DNA_ORIENTATION=+
MTSALDTLFLGPTRRGGGVGGSASNSSRALADSVGASWSRPRGSDRASSSVSSPTASASIPLSGASRRLHFNSESMPCPVIGSSTTFAPLWASNRPTSSNAAVAWNSLALFQHASFAPPPGHALTASLSGRRLKRQAA